MKLLSAYLLAATLTAIAALTHAAPISTNFNALTPTSMVTAQYSPMGATFSLIPSPTEPGSPLPPPAGPTVWSLGPVDQFGVNGNSIIVGPTTIGPFYDVQVDFDRPIDYFSIVALDAETAGLRLIAYNGDTQVPLQVSSTYLGTITALPYVSGPTYLLEIGEAGGKASFDRIVFGGTEQFDNLTYSPVQDPAATVSIVGDKDGFGIGAVVDEAFEPGSLLGYDGQGDADGTDTWFFNEQSFEFVYTLPASAIEAAQLEVFTGGQGYNPSNPSVGAPTPVFLNNTLIGYLTVGDIGLSNNNIARKDVFDLWPYVGLLTGNDTIRFRPTTTGTAIGDGWVLDYAEITLNSAGPSPAEMLQQLLEDVTGVGPGTSLADKVMLAQTYYMVPDITSTCSMLSDFKSQVSAQSGKKLDEALAAQLLDDATEIMLAIECE